MVSPGMHFPPEYDEFTEYRDHIADEPEICGVHNNANIAFQVRGDNGLLKFVSLWVDKVCWPQGRLGHRIEILKAEQTFRDVVFPM